MGILEDISRWLWRLVPANPILVRVVQGASRRSRHLYIRSAYLLVLFGVILLAKLLLQDKGGVQSLDELARSNCQVFMWVSRVQLAIMCLLAPVFAAGAITQERDSQTYNILQSTPLSNAQIVLGSLLSRLYFVIVLLLAGLPIFCITMLYGGVTLDQIFLSSALAGCTAVVTAALAIAMSVVKVGSRQTMFGFYGLIAGYLVVVYGLSLLGGFQVPEAQPNLDGTRMSWLAAFHPFLALQVVFNSTPPPDPSAVAHYGWPMRDLLAYPHLAYQLITLLAAGVMITVSIFFARASAWEGELNWFWRVKGLLTREPLGQRRRRPRHVWKNPVAWREAVTRAAASGRSVVRGGFVLAGLVAAGWCLVEYLLNPAQVGPIVRPWLARLVFAELAIILLMAGSAAAGAITREREANSLDLLLVTPLSSRYVIRGKLRGLVSFLAPMLAVPAITLLIFAAVDLSRTPMARLVQPETPFFLAPIMLLFAAVVCILGVQVSLRARKTVQAMIHALGLVLLGGLLLSGCGHYLCQNETLGSFASAFTPLTAVMVPLDPASAMGVAGQQWTAAMTSRVRVFSAAGSTVAIAAYALLAVSLYRSIIRNYDMTIRKQSAGG